MDNKRPEDMARRKLEGIRTKMLLKYGEHGLRRLFIGVVISFIVLLLLIVAVFLLRIQTIDVIGDVTVFNEGEVIAAAEIDVGDGLFWKPGWVIKGNIEKNMPLAQNIKVRKSLLGKVTISIELLSIDYYFKYGDKYYALDEDLKVLGVDKSKTKYSPYGAVYLVLPEVRKPVLGQKLVFYDTVEETDTNEETLYEIREESFYDYTTRFLSELKKSGYHTDADGVVLTEKFDVVLIYSQKFKVIFGDTTSLDTKFRVLYEILAEGSMQYTEKGIIDLSNPSRAIARPDNKLDFSEFLD